MPCARIRDAVAYPEVCVRLAWIFCTVERVRNRQIKRRWDDKMTRYDKIWEDMTRFQACFHWCLEIVETFQCHRSQDLLDRMILDADPKTGKYMWLDEKSEISTGLTLVGTDATWLCERKMFPKVCFFGSTNWVCNLGSSVDFYAQKGMLCGCHRPTDVSNRCEVRGVDRRQPSDLPVCRARLYSRCDGFMPLLFVLQSWVQGQQYDSWKLFGTWGIFLDLR